MKMVSCAVAGGWTTVLRFARKPHASKIQEGHVYALDDALHRARVKLAGDHHEFVASIQPGDINDALMCLVHAGDDEGVRIEASVDAESAGGRSRIVELRVAVLPDVVSRKLDKGTLRVEEAIVELAKSVWREAATHRTFTEAHEAHQPTTEDPRLSHEAEDRVESGVEQLPRVGNCATWWNATHPLLAHQVSTVAWMQHIEHAMPRTIQYAGNLHVCGEWYVDTETEAFTRDPSWREATLSGALCADFMGAGKTAMALYVALSRPRLGDAVGGSLFVLPLHLVAQWQEEVRKFVDTSGGPRILWIVHGRDLRDLHLADLEGADLVFTTFQFLRAA